MKSIFKFFLIPLLPLLFWTGCKRESLPSQEGIPDHCIEITLGGLHPSLTSKASIRGEDVYHENLVESVDCFFYPDGRTDEPAVFTALGRGASVVAEADSTVYKVRVFFTDTDARNMFGNTVSGTCQVFVICNAPLSYGSDTSIDALKELVVENDFTAQTIQGSFVMSADESSTVTLVTDGEGVRTASGRIKVTRACAKIQFFLAIPAIFLDEENHTWEPVLSAGVGISMSNAVKKGKVYGDYIVQPADYVDYSSRLVDSLEVSERISGREDYKYTHVPFYSYPCSWSDLSDNASSVVFRIAWKRTESSDYTWKKYQLSPNIATMDFKRNNYYRTFVAVHSLGGADKEEKVIIPESNYEVLPWMNESTSGGGQGVVPGELITYKYLVMDHPEQVINNEETVYFTYVSSSPIASVQITTIQYYVNTNANPLQTQNVNRTITADSQTISTNAGSITVDKSNPGYVKFYRSLDNVYSSVTINAVITNEDGCTQNVQVVQNPSIQLIRETGAGNVFVNGWFARLTSVPPGTGWNSNNYRYTDNTQNASGTFYHNGRNTLWSTSYNRMTAGTTTINGHTCGTYGIVLGAVNNLNNTIDRNFYTTLITVSSFNSSNDYYTANNEEIHYRIGDPRVPASDVYNGGNAWTNESNFYAYVYHNNSPTEVAGSWEEPGSILIATQVAEDQSIIAPMLLVSSALNANESLTFPNIVKRGATYQEAGYPAGRWRLPTEAEIAFIVARQKEGVIPVLYATNTDYWAGSGRLVEIPAAANAAITFSNPASASTVSSCRYVYDLWYWGEDPSTTNQYHPNGHLYDYDASGNATLIR
ncbi:MAG: hypothetical protein II891_02895 [Bacteroidales bacterium]|nr:hypothetical protein [Bacteroidales bacterium]